MRILNESDRGVSVGEDPADHTPADRAVESTLRLLPLILAHPLRGHGRNAMNRRKAVCSDIRSPKPLSRRTGPREILKRAVHYAGGRRCNRGSGKVYAVKGPRVLQDCPPLSCSVLHLS